MAELKPKRVWIAVPLLALIGLSFVCLQNAAAGPWHDRCLELWKSGEWHQLIALANNLSAVEKPDTEAYFFATLASAQQGDSSQTRILLDRLLQRRFLNRQMERHLAFARVSPSGLKDILRLHRTSAVLGIFALLAILSVLSWKWTAGGSWIAVVAALGCAVLMI